ncbi:hypothetical protein B0H13DRAFT_1851081 [Mycena leptocephala]|nr:hypothetical protein B0H13DRAFT_1851081 [Mycena leptocephala]
MYWESLPLHPSVPWSFYVISGAGSMELRAVETPPGLWAGFEPAGLAAGWEKKQKTQMMTNLGTNNFNLPYLPYIPRCRQAHHSGGGPIDGIDGGKGGLMRTTFLDSSRSELAVSHPGEPDVSFGRLHLVIGAIRRYTPSDQIPLSLARIISSIFSGFTIRRHPFLCCWHPPHRAVDQARSYWYHYYYFSSILGNIFDMIDPAPPIKPNIYLQLEGEI